MCVLIVYFCMNMQYSCTKLDEKCNIALLYFGLCPKCVVYASKWTIPTYTKPFIYRLFLFNMNQENSLKTIWKLSENLIKIHDMDLVHKYHSVPLWLNTTYFNATKMYAKYILSSLYQQLLKYFWRRNMDSIINELAVNTVSLIKILLSWWSISKIFRAKILINYVETFTFRSWWFHW